MKTSRTFAILRVAALIYCLHPFQSTSLAQGAGWQPIGQDLKFAAHIVAACRSGLLYAASPIGVFCSQDSGGTWITCNGDISDTCINVVGVDSSGFVYAGTQHGIFRSTNAGMHWVHVLTQDINVVTMASGPGGTIYAGTYQQGLFVSTNGGTDWNSLPSDPVTSTALLVTGNGYILESGGFDYSPGVQKSTDGGAQWTSTLAGERVYRLAEAPDHTLFAAVLMGIKTSTDGGSSWRSYSGTSLEGRTFTGLLPRAGGTCICSDNLNNVYVTSDSGGHWTDVSLGAPVSEINYLSVDSSGGVYAATDAGVFASRDGGMHWSRDSSDFPQRIIQSLVSTPGGTIFAGTDNGVYRSRDFGRTWIHTIRPMTPGGVGMPMADNLLYDRAGTLFALYRMGGTLASTNEGDTWYWTPLVDTMTLCTELDTSSALLGGDMMGGISRSSDEGHHATLIGRCTNWHSVNALKVSPDGDLIVGSDYWGMYRSRDNARTWQGFGLTNNYINTLLLLSGGGIMAGTDQGIFRWRDTVSGWVPKNNGMPIGSIRSLVRSSTGTIVAAGSEGVFYSTDEGENWNPLSSGLGNATVLSLAFDTRGDLIAGTTSGAFLTGTVLGITTAQTPLPERFSLAQNYPNPFNPSTRIRYTLHSRSPVVLSVYNELGQCVATLVRTVEEPGLHEVEFDAGRLASGIYFYRLQAGANVIVRNMTLIR